jgi:hypothetical protein
MLPVGGVTVDGGPSCADCGQWTTVLVGFPLSDPYPVWAPFAGAALGAFVALAVILVGSAPEILFA